MMKTSLIVCLSVMLLASGALAETAPPPPNPNDGAFEKLSPGNQKIAQALFDAQQSDSTGTGSTTTELLSRDDIAAMKQQGQGWGQVFKSMKSQGLVQAKNLGQVVSQSNLAAHSGSNGTVITSGSGRTFVEGAKVKPGHMGSGENGSGAASSLSSGGSGGGNAGLGAKGGDHGNKHGK